MAMAEPRDWQQDDERQTQEQERLRAAEERARLAEEQRVQAEGRCFAAERRRLDAERRLAEVQALLEEARAAGERTRDLVAELIGLAAQLRRRIERAPAERQTTPPCSEQDAAERAQMADALAAAVERLRARVAEVKAVEEPPPAAEPQAASAAAPSAADAIAAPASGAPAPSASGAPASRPAHKHSMSGIARWRLKRKQRKAA